MGRQRAVCISIMVLTMLVIGCATQTTTRVDTRDFMQSSSKSGMRDTELSAGDTIEISVEVDGSMEVTRQRANINHRGVVTLPLVGDVMVGGLNLDIARSVIAKRYGVYYVAEPVIMVARVDEDAVSEWGQVTVLGRVENPGPVPLSSGSGMKLSAAIQAAGGFATSANTAKIQVTRVDNLGRKLRVMVDFDEIGETGNAVADLMLMDGDIVNVPERYW